MNKAINIQQHKGRRALIISLVVLVALIAFDISPFGGNVRFYATWIGCGQKPVASDISLGFGAKVLNYIEPSAIQVVRFGQPNYFCTPLEAEKAGYSANPNQYEFPHLQQEI